MYYSLAAIVCCCMLYVVCRGGLFAVRCVMSFKFVVCCCVLVFGVWCLWFVVVC